MSPRVRAALLSAVLPLALLTACGGDDEAAPARSDTPAAGSSAEDASHPHTDAPVVGGKKLRAGEERVTVAMQEPYTASAPTGVGTDDYRCFLLDPGLDEDKYLTGTQVLPGNPDVVHHVILFEVPPDLVRKAEIFDGVEDGPGWTCFGGTGLTPSAQIDDAPWLAAWAPGGKETVTKPGYGKRLEKGSRIVMQVHYNLLAGTRADVSATQLRLAPVSKKMTPLTTMLLPAPVELPCRPEHADGELCDRDVALADVKERFGEKEGSTADILHLLCGEIDPGAWQSCKRTVKEPMTIHGVAGHMHLLGRQLKIEVNAGTDRARTVLDIPVWDFDQQGGIPIKPVALKPQDTVTVSCRHVQWLRDQLPSFEGQPDRYVVWGEGTTDEMCLGMLQYSRP